MLQKPETEEGRGDQERKPPRLIRSVGLGVVAGAADDDCSAIGTYASAGAQFGPSLLWTAPVTFPMIYGRLPVLEARTSNWKGPVPCYQGAISALDTLAYVDRRTDREYHR